MKFLKFNKKEWSYIFYDWAESAFTVVFATFIFPGLYSSLTESGGLSTDQSSILWQIITASLSILIAIASPILGTISDYRGYKNRFFKVFFYLGIVSSALIPLYPYFDWWVVLIPYSIATIAYSATNVFYDSFIVDATTDERMDAVSTTGYAFGYIGGSTIPLVLGIALLGILESTTLALQLTFIVTSLWWLLFSVPFLRNVKQVYGIEPERNPVGKSFKRLFSTLKEVTKYKKIFLFLIAFFLYIDGVHTIISQAVVFATNAIPEVSAAAEAGTVNQILLPIFLMIQILAFVFALLFSYLGKFFKTETLLMVTIGIYAFISLFGFFVDSLTLFTILGLLVATAQGAIQSLSRSYFGKIVPKEKANEFFGLYTVFSRVAAFMGPLIIASVSSLVLYLNGTNQIDGGAMRYGILALVVFFIAGGLIFNYARRLPNPGQK